MSMGWVTLIGIVVVVALVVILVRFMNRDKLEAIMKKRKVSSLLVSYGELVEPRERLPIVMALDANKLYYENADIQAYLELKNVEEVEYDDELSTGGSVEGKILRVRSHGHTFEFVVSKADASKWEAKLPHHRADEPGSVHTA